MNDGTMKHEQRLAREQAEVMLAFAEGKRVELRQLCSSGAWDLCTFPAWNWANFEYRVAPEPRVFYVNVYPAGVSAYTDEAEAREFCVDSAGETIKVMEVME